MKKLIFFFLLIPLFSFAQLKEFNVSEMERPDVAIVQANAQWPDDALLLVYSSLKDLNFRSSLGGIDKVSYNTQANRYEILFKPNKQMLFVYANNFIEQKIETFNPNPKDVYYYQVEEKVIISADAEPGVLKVVSTPPGASIKLNGTQILEKTPTLLELPAGKFKLKLEKNGYLPCDTIINVRTDQVSTLGAVLQEDPDFNLLGQWEHISQKDDLMPSFLLKIVENGTASLTVYEGGTSPSYHIYEFIYEGDIRGTIGMSIQKAYQLETGKLITESALDSLKGMGVSITFGSSSDASISFWKYSHEYMQPMFREYNRYSGIELSRVEGVSLLPFMGRWWIDSDNDGMDGGIHLEQDGTGYWAEPIPGPYTENFKWAQEGKNLSLYYQDLQATWGYEKTFPTDTYLGKLSIGSNNKLIWEAADGLPNYIGGTYSRFSPNYE